MEKNKKILKKHDAKVLWVDDKRTTTLLSSEVSDSSTKVIDIMKHEGDRRKIIRCIKFVSRNLWSIGTTSTFLMSAYRN